MTQCTHKNCLSFVH